MPPNFGHVALHIGQTLGLGLLLLVSLFLGQLLRFNGVRCLDDFAGLDFSGQANRFLFGFGDLFVGFLLALVQSAGEIFRRPPIALRPAVWPLRLGVFYRWAGRPPRLDVTEP